MLLLKAQRSDGKNIVYLTFELFGMQHLGTDLGERNISIL